MNKQNIVISFLVIVILAMAGAWYFSDKKVDIKEIKNTSEVKNFNTITIGDGPIEFDLPQGYGVYTSGLYEGGYEFTIRMGKMLKDNYFSESVPTIYIRDFVPQTGSAKEYKEYNPSEYVDIIFAGAHPEINKPKIIMLFGNRAVQTISDADGNPFVVGHLRGDQLPESFGRKEYLVTIDGTTYGSGKEFNQKLFDLVVNSLRIKSD